MTADLEAARAGFLHDWPEYASTIHLDARRASDYARLDAGGHVYLDYTGAGLYAQSQVQAHAALLEAGVFGNPHSASPASAASTDLVERARRAVLRWFNAERDYVVVFTQNATAALKLVGEAYPFAPGGQLLLASDNHNSVNGLREYARARGVEAVYAPLAAPDLRLDRDALSARLQRPADGPPGLFVFPAQSNFSGVVHPLELVEEAHAAGWDVLVDAAAFVPTHRLDLERWRPAFATVSFYKMFGYPTGVGCLLARRDALARLQRPWFAGGTVNFATVRGRVHRLSPGEAGFEDGTLNYLSIPAVEIGLQHLEALGIDAIETRVRCLTGWLLRELMALAHANGRPLVRIYGPAATTLRGGTITLNAYDPDGRLLDYRRVEELAGEAGISLRTGCFCNPGAGETAEGLTDEDITAAVAGVGELSLPRFLQFVTHRSGKSAGAVRVSFGLASTFGDAHRFLTFVAGLRERTRLAIGEATFDIASCRVIRDGA